MSQILDTLAKQDLSLFQIKKIKKNEVLFREGESCKMIGILKEGSLVISSYTFEGKEIIFNSIKPGMMFGNNLLFSKEPHYKGNVTAMMDSEIYLINETNLLALCTQNKSFLKEYLSLTANTAISLNERIKMLSFNSLEERFSYALFLHNGVLPYKSISNLAKELNVERETLSRYISKQISIGLIRKDDHRLIDLSKK